MHIKAGWVQRRKCFVRDRISRTVKLLFLTTDAGSFWSHRLMLARSAKKEGFDVVIMAPRGAHCPLLEKEGFRVVPWSISRRSLNPFREFWSFLQVLGAYREERPDLVHHIALKPIVYGSLAARLCGSIPYVNSIIGLGLVFTKTSLHFKALQNLLTRVLGLCCGATNGRVVVQNEDDRKLLIEKKIAVLEKITVIPGFGIDTDEFTPSPEPEGEFLVVLPARMLWEKGVAEFVEAARVLRERSVAVRMVLVGAPDPENLGCIPETQLRKWAKGGAVEWWGQQSNMSAILRCSHVVCLPSYREGLPKVLLEAAACGRAIITTDAPGCSSSVAHGENGLIVSVKDSLALADAIESLLKDKTRRLQMGAAGRQKAVSQFSSAKILSQIFGAYEAVLGEKWRSKRSPASQSELQNQRLSPSVLSQE